MEFLERPPAQIEAGEFVERYDRARALRLDGRLDDAEALLMLSVSPPSIYHGHYRELFLIFRDKNKRDLKAGLWGEVIDRVRFMITLEDEMISAMLEYWSAVHKKKLPKKYFDSYRKLKLSDGKSMLKAAGEFANAKAKKEALKLLNRFAVNVTATES